MTLLLCCISDVRRALGDFEQRIIQTIPRRGYIFAAKVSDLAKSGPRAAASGPAVSCGATFRQSQR